MADSLINFGDISKPATVLIEKISDAVGGVFKPYQIVRVAEAEAKAQHIHALAQIEVTELQERALRRFVQEEARNQENMEQITTKAIPLLDSEASPGNVDKDWIANFFDKCRIVSDEDMQLLWSSILAGEANMPGKFSKRTINLLADLDKSDAQMFSRLCGFGWVIGNIVPLVYDLEDKIYKDNGINFSSLSHLESLGLIQFNELTGYVRHRLPKSFTAFYYGQPVTLSLPNDSNNQLDLGKVLLTKAGQELAPVSQSVPVTGFFDYVYARWAKQSYVPQKNA